MAHQIPDIMTEAQIERRAERQMDAIDRAYLRGDLDETAYTDLVRKIDAWATLQCRLSAR